MQNNMNRKMNLYEIGLIEMQFNTINTMKINDLWW